MKLLLRTEGLPGAEIFTEIERNDAPEEIIIPISLSARLKHGIKEEEFRLTKVGYADGMPYYRRLSA